MINVEIKKKSDDKTVLAAIVYKNCALQKIMSKAFVTEKNSKEMISDKFGSLL